MKAILTDLKAKILTDIYLFFDYWFIWLGILVVMTGLCVFLRLTERDDGKETD